MTDVATLSIAQIQAFVIAVCTALVVVAPIIAGVAIMVIKQIREVAKAVGAQEAQNGTITDLQRRAVDHTQAITALQERVNMLTTNNGPPANGG